MTGVMNHKPRRPASGSVRNKVVSSSRSSAATGPIDASVKEYGRVEKAFLEKQVEDSI